MADNWTVTGASGASVDETEHSLEQLGAQGGTVEFRSLAADTMRWSIPFDQAVGTDAVIPDLGQKLRLFRDGVRFFEGHVTGRRIVGNPRSPRASITVAGPWWWLSQVMLSSEEEDQAGTTKERPQFVFSTGSPRTNLIALIARAIALGAPISEGSIASVFSVPRLTVRNVPLAEAFAEVMRWVADGVLYFDYSVEGYPALSMQRRPASSTVTLTPTETICPLIDIGPRIDLEVKEVVVQSAKRSTVGNKRLTVWQESLAGDASAESVPSRQIALVTGPEIDLWLPQDFTDSVVVRSKPITVSSAVNGAVFSELDPGLRATSAGSFSVGPAAIDLGGGSTLNITGPSTALVDRDGNLIPSGFAYYLVEGEARDWWPRAGIEHIEARLTAVIWQEQAFNQPDGAPADPLWYESFGGKTHTLLNGASSKKWWWTTVSIPVTLVKTLWSDSTTLIRPEDYAWVNPPDGLADNLLETQDWLPWEGSVQFVHPGDIPGGHHLGKALNIAAFRSETANMRSLIVGHSVELDTGLAALSVGAPDRFAFRDLVNRFRMSGADNIVYLTDVVDGDGGNNPDPDPELQIPLAPDGSLAFDGSALTFSGDFITHFVLAGDLAFNGDQVVYSDDQLSYN